MHRNEVGSLIIFIDLFCLFAFHFEIYLHGCKGKYETGGDIVYRTFAFILCGRFKWVTFLIWHCISYHMVLENLPLIKWDTFYEYELNYQSKCLFVSITRYTPGADTTSWLWTSCVSESRKERWVLLIRARHVFFVHLFFKIVHVFIDVFKLSLD